MTVESVMPLCNNLLINWNTNYSCDHFETCKDFDGCQIPDSKFFQVPLIQKLVDAFTIMYPFLTVGMVWIIASLNVVVDFSHGAGTSS